jgi:hypothetical protein
VDMSNSMHDYELLDNCAQHEARSMTTLHTTTNDVGQGNSLHMCRARGGQVQYTVHGPAKDAAHRMGLGLITPGALGATCAALRPTAFTQQFTSHWKRNSAPSVTGEDTSILHRGNLISGSMLGGYLHSSLGSGY